MTVKQAIIELKIKYPEIISTGKSILKTHGQDESYYPNMAPDAVIFPRNTKEVANIVTICATHDCPVIPWGRGTSLEAHALAPNGGVTLDFANMNAVIEINDEDLDVCVQPGISRTELNNELRATGLFFPVDPGADATLGGMAATRASGTTAVRYGTMRENVLGLEVVLADGRIIKTGTRARKSSSGYDLTKLIVGSEGTLGIITELTLRLHGQPESIAAATCYFENIENAISAVSTAIQMGVSMARIEFIDDIAIKGFNHHYKTDMSEQPHLFFEFHGSPQTVKEQSETIGEIISEFDGDGFKWSTKAEERTELWRMRHNGFYAAKALRPQCEVVTTDICVPISRLAETIIATREETDKSGLICPMLGHVGDGNFHVAILIDPNDPNELKQAKALSHNMVKRALAMDGTISGEHGIGLGKLQYMAEEHGDAWSVMKDIKRSMDPKNIMNPGKLAPLN